MAFVIIWLFLSIIAAVIASNKGRSGMGFFFLAIFLSPLVGIIAALAAKPNQENIEKKELAMGDSIKCPYCAELIRRDAIVCRYCGRDLQVEQARQEGA